MPSRSCYAAASLMAGSWKIDFSSFPDLHHEIVDLVAEGDKVVVRFNVTDTHKGELQGIPPTGKKISFGAMDFITLMDGKIIEGWLSVDMMELM